MCCTVLSATSWLNLYKGQIQAPISKDSYRLNRCLLSSVRERPYCRSHCLEGGDTRCALVH